MYAFILSKNYYPLSQNCPGFEDDLRVVSSSKASAFERFTSMKGDAISAEQLQNFRIDDFVFVEAFTHIHYLWLEVFGCNTRPKISHSPTFFTF